MIPLNKYFFLELVYLIWKIWDLIAPANYILLYIP
jgi:hypothetical protein